MEKVICGQYSVTDCGEVYSNDFMHKGIKQRLKTRLNRGGYEVVTIWVEGIRKDTTVHQLVAQAFIPNPEDKPTVNHKDGNKLNNHVSNLEWATRSEQEQHARSIGLKNNKHLERAIVQFDPLTGDVIAEYDSIIEARNATGCRSASICMVCKGQYKTSCGFGWRYKEV
jgi:hypothetical protein